MMTLHTERLIIRDVTPEDAAFILEMLNDPEWLRFIGDRGVGDLASAEVYIRDRLQLSSADRSE